MPRLEIRVKDVEHYHKLSVRTVVERSVAPAQRRRICTRDACIEKCYVKTDLPFRDLGENNDI
jgi:hypothetical protein